MLAALLTLAGVLVGTGGTLLATRMATRAAAADSRQARLEAREAALKELAADAYVAAVEAVAWLSTMHIEDSVNPRFADEYEPKTERAVERLRTAKDLMGKVAALGGGPEFSKLTLELVVALDVLAFAWESGQEACRKQVALPEGAEGPWANFVRRRFDEAYDDLNQVRKQLCGFEAELPRKELAQGSVLEGSLLYRLRAMTGSDRLS